MMQGPSAHGRRQFFRRRQWRIVATCVTGMCLLFAGPVNAQATRPADDTWEAIFLGGSKVGHGHTTRREIERNGQRCVEITSETQLTVKRFGQSIAQNLLLSCVETSDGQLVGCESDMNSGPSRITTSGRLSEGQLSMTTATQGKSTVAHLDWKDEYGGFFAAEQSLRREPLQPGQRRRLRTLLPIFNQLADVELEATDFEATPMLDGTRNLLKVNGTTRLGGNAIESTMWVDRRGEIWKTQVAGIGQETYRTTKDIALNQPTGEGFDLGDFSVIRIDRTLRDPHGAKRIVYRARLEDQDPSGLFVSDFSQQVRSLDRHTAEIVVQAVSPDQPPSAGATASPSTPADLAPNNLIQSDDRRVRNMAAEVASSERDSWAVAQALEKYVHDAVRTKNFSQALATAAEVAESLEGDCTEHAVLLAALCRARNIPARVAIGLVHFPQQQGFAYHMWNEVWIRDRWIPLDATLGRGGIGAGHLKLAVSNLDGSTAYSAFVPVFQVMGRLQLEVIDVDE